MLTHHQEALHQYEEQRHKHRSETFGLDGARAREEHQARNGRAAARPCPWLSLSPPPKGSSRPARSCFSFSNKCDFRPWLLLAQASGMQTNDQPQDQSQLLGGEVPAEREKRQTHNRLATTSRLACPRHLGVRDIQSRHSIKKPSGISAVDKSKPLFGL